MTPLKQQDIQLGLCCMNMGLREDKPPVFASRTMRIKTINLLKCQNRLQQIAH